MTPIAKQIVHSGMQRQKPLCPFCGLDSLHLPLSSPCCLVRVLCPAVRVTLRIVYCAHKHICHGRKITFEPISDNNSGRYALAFQYFSKEPFGRFSISMSLHQNIRDVAILA